MDEYKGAEDKRLFSARKAGENEPFVGHLPAGNFLRLKLLRFARFQRLHHPLVPHLHLKEKTLPLLDIHMP